MYCSSDIMHCLTFISVLFHPALARIYQKNVRVRHSPIAAHFDALMGRGFGFLPGGELHFTLQCSVSVMSSGIITCNVRGFDRHPFIDTFIEK